MNALPPRAVAGVLAAAATVLLATGCTFTAKAHAEKLLVGAPKRLAAQGPIQVRVTARSTPSATAKRAGVVTDPGLAVSGTLDLQSEQASYTLTGRNTPYAVFDGLSLYGRRPGAAADDARPWVALDASSVSSVQRVDFTAQPSSAIVLLLPPSLLVDLMSGALSGSIRDLGSEVIDGVAVTAYRANIDIGKALSEGKRRHYSQSMQNKISRLLRAVDVTPGGLQHGEIWVDRDGVPRRFQLTLRQHPQQHVSIDLTIDMSFTKSTKLTLAAAPSADQVVTVPTFFQYLTALTTASATAAPA